MAEEVAPRRGGHASRGGLIVAIAGLAAVATAAWLSSDTPRAPRAALAGQVLALAPPQDQAHGAARRAALAAALERSAAMTETLAALAPWATRAHIVREVCSCAAWLPRRPWHIPCMAAAPPLAHTMQNEHTCHRRQSDLLICLRVRAQIKAEAEKAGVGMAAAAHRASGGADGAVGGQLPGASRQELVKYIKHQEHLLSNIESLSGINIDQLKHEHEHHFKHSERTEHYDNIFANAAKEDHDPDAFESQAGTESSGDAAARAWNLVRPLASWRPPRTAHTAGGKRCKLHVRHGACCVPGAELGGCALPL